MTITPEPRVEILLATYNGERFLREQIDSLLQQDYGNFRVLARDDGSQDDTGIILQEYEDRFPGQFSVVAGSGVSSGSAGGNFSQLMLASSADYVAFSDQDDVWTADKISRQMACMHRLEEQHGREKPLLVFTNLAVVNDDLSTRSPSFWAQQGILPERVHTLNHLLVQNVVTGCTSLINRPLLEYAETLAPGVFLHDRWIGLLACVFGKGEFLAETSVLYRQHGDNTIGAGERRRSIMMRFWNNARRRSQWEVTETFARAMLTQWNADLPDEARHTLKRFVEIRSRRWGVLRAHSMLSGEYLLTSRRANVDMLWYLLQPASRLQQKDFVKRANAAPSESVTQLR
jgi:glycosyltransferase involved in cell wall biosynthesis